MVAGAALLYGLSETNQFWMRPMTLTLVLDDTDVPARFGAGAGALAAAEGTAFHHLPARFDTVRDADAAQYVFAAGGLGPSGLVWAERALGSPVRPASSPAEIVAAAAAEPVTVPLHPAFLADGEAVAGLERAAVEAGIAVRRVTVVETAAGLALADAPPGTPPLLWRDRFGGLHTSPRTEPGGPALAIALIGGERDHRDIYPAAVASLADAAEHLGIALDVHFVPPPGLDGAPEAIAGRLSGFAGVLLPGGSDMANVPGQIRAAAATLAAGVPTVGLCLGMQTMSTAVAWRAFGAAVASLAEADPAAPIKTFVAMAGASGGEGPLPEHRTGDQPVAPVAGSRLAAVLPRTPVIRCNHRFHLAPALVPDLERAGLKVAATGCGGGVVDAVEVPAHPFFMGMQGHPELGTRRGAPHPLLVAFLAAAARHVRNPAVA